MPPCAQMLNKIHNTVKFAGRQIVRNKSNSFMLHHVKTGGDSPTEVKMLNRRTRCCAPHKTNIMRTDMLTCTPVHKEIHKTKKSCGSSLSTLAARPKTRALSVLHAPLETRCCDDSSDCLRRGEVVRKSRSMECVHENLKQPCCAG